MAENLAELFSVVEWKAEFISNEHGYLAEAISKQSVKGICSLIVIAKCEKKEMS